MIMIVVIIYMRITIIHILVPNIAMIMIIMLVTIITVIGTKLLFTNKLRNEVRKVDLLINSLVTNCIWNNLCARIIRYIDTCFCICT